MAITFGDKTDDGDDDDAWCEVEDCPSGVTDTLLQEPDMTENVVLHRVKERPVMDKES